MAKKIKPEKSTSDRQVPPVARINGNLSHAARAMEDIKREDLPALDSGDSPGPGESLPPNEGLPHSIGESSELGADTKAAVRQNTAGRSNFKSVKKRPAATRTKSSGTPKQCSKK